MTREPGLQSYPALQASRVALPPIVPVLIQVPAVPSLLRASGRAASRPHRRPVARRRRLRREVRMAGYTVMMIAPLSLASALLMGGRSGGALEPALPAVARAAAESAAPGCDRPGLASAPPIISISLEPAALSPYAEVEPQVVLPGYLLPDDECEEPAHAGS
jgi:hypothetical protein